MIYAKNRSQKELPFNIHGINNVKYEYLENSLYGIFRHNFLSNIPIKLLKDFFSTNMGRKTKDIQSIVGLYILQHILDLSDKQTVESFLFDQRFHYALDISEKDAYLSFRCFYSYKKILIGKESELFVSTLKTIKEKINIDCSIQRTDSSIIELNIKNMSQWDLFKTTIKNFLKDTQKKHPVIYNRIPENIRKYNQDASKSSWYTKYSPSESKELLFQAAMDALELRSLFEDHPDISKQESFQYILRILKERVSEEDDGQITVKLKKEDRGSALVSPYDPDAQFQGHKKKIGVKCTISETCSSDSEIPDPNIVTNIEVDKANVSDQNILQDTIEHRENNGVKPEIELTDNGYDSETNSQSLEAKNVDLICPPSCKEPEGFGIIDFKISINGQEVQECPMGKPCIKNQVKPDKEETRSYFDKAICEQCPHQEECPVKITARQASLSWQWDKPRMEARLFMFFQNAWIACLFRQRAGGEASFSQLKNAMGLRRIRVRGFARSRFSLIMATIGLNVIRTGDWILNHRSSAPSG